MECEKGMQSTTLLECFEPNIYDDDNGNIISCWVTEKKMSHVDMKTYGIVPIMSTDKHDETSNWYLCFFFCFVLQWTEYHNHHASTECIVPILGTGAMKVDPISLAYRSKLFSMTWNENWIWLQISWFWLLHRRIYTELQKMLVCYAFACLHHHKCEFASGNLWFSLDRIK